jgi:hypothetical protein
MRIAIVFLVGLLAACGSSKQSKTSSMLYEVLTQQETGGGNIKFYEIITEANEMAMLLQDENLKGKVTRTDIENHTFLILNMGEKRTGGYKIAVQDVKEEADKVVVKVKDILPIPGSPVAQMLSYPYTIVKIQSKKPVVVE